MTRSHAHRGSIYLVVLAATALVVTMALIGIELGRRDLKTSSVMGDSVAARIAAESGVDYAIAYMQQSTWRQSVGAGTIASNKAIGTATFGVTLNDDTGSIGTSSLDTIRITSVGQSGDAKVTLQANAKPVGIVPEHLNYIVCAQTTISFGTATVSGTGTIRAGGLATAVLANILQRVESNPLPVGVTYNGGIVANLSSLSTIDMTSIINYYKAIGTNVSYTSLTSGEIRNQVVSQDTTPWGVTNTYGVYIIDCKGSNVRIRNARIIGTLVFINATANVDIDQSVNFVPGTSTYPCVICDGKLNLGMDNAVLSEVSLAVNFNPAGAAGTDRIGTTDTDKLDTYQSRIYGVVFANSIAISNKQRLQGCAISQSTVSFSGTPGLVYDSTVYSSPPPGFTVPGNIYIVENSWKRLAN